MLRLVTATAIVALMSACASAPPPATTGSASAPLSDPPAPVETNPPGSPDVVEFAEAPAAPVAAAPVAEARDPRDEIVCMMERRTGTNRKVRVCRPRSGNPAATQAAKETFDTLRRSQQPEN